VPGLRSAVPKPQRCQREDAKQSNAVLVGHWLIQANCYGKHIPPNGDAVNLKQPNSRP